MTSGPHGQRVWSRRGFLQRTLSGVAGWALWQGWPSRHLAMAQKGAPAGQMTWAMHITLAPTWFDPVETGALLTPYICLRALHDALVKPMPDGHMVPCLATRWHESADGLTYDFELRHGVKFHNGDPYTAADVQFSFERYKGAGAAGPRGGGPLDAGAGHAAGESCLHCAQPSGRGGLERCSGTRRLHAVRDPPADRLAPVRRPASGGRLCRTCSGRTRVLPHLLRHLRAKRYPAGRSRRHVCGRTQWSVKHIALAERDTVPPRTPGQCVGFALCKHVLEPSPLTSPSDGR